MMFAHRHILTKEQICRQISIRTTSPATSGEDMILAIALFSHRPSADCIRIGGLTRDHGSSGFEGRMSDQPRCQLIVLFATREI